MNIKNGAVGASELVATFSSGIAKNTIVKKVLGIHEIILKPKSSHSISYVVGWGRKGNTNQARVFAGENQLKYYALEDGFIHSMGQGVLGSQSCSLVVDGTGIYYDATHESDLEGLILNDCEPVELQRAKNTIQRLIKTNISKYNNGSLKLNNCEYEADETVLVIDQTAGDMSLKYGYVTESSFKEMLNTALNDHPNAQIILKTHPDVIVGKKEGNIKLSNLDPRVCIVSEVVNPLVLLKKVDVVYVATSQMGFEALMLGKRVICFGVPFYSGWGLTDDRADQNLNVWKRRSQKRTLEEVFLAAYINYTHYLHPDTQETCRIEDVISYFELQYQNKLKLPGKPHCINFTRWKKNHITAFLGLESGSQNSPLFVSSATQAIKKGFDSSSQLVTWASKNQEEVDQLVEQFDISPWQVEDGFIRSAGLGTDLTAPASLVLDKTGVYYDPTQTSDLEILLQNKVFSTDELRRADSLKNTLLENELSKYNLGGNFSKASLSAKPSQNIILIPGQVEGDASIKKGCVDISLNTDLIKAVREENPDAYLIYKPHPDVVSGNRKGKVSRRVIQEYTNLELIDVSITDCLAVVNEVHTMTSLVGFEGLIRKLRVVCYGRPFYSGWGLTKDRYHIERRTRKLELNELVAGVLIDYPRYINWQTGKFTTPEVIVEQLKNKIISQGGKQTNQVFWLKRQARKLHNIYRGVFTRGRM